MSKHTDNYAAVAPAVGLRYDTVNNVMYGQKDGYDIVVYAEDKAHPYMLTIHIAARNMQGANLTKEQLHEMAQSAKPLGVCAQDGNNIIVKLPAAMGKNIKQEKLQASVAEGLNAVIVFLRSNGFVPCCSICGKGDVEVSAHLAGGGFHHLCADCETSMRGRIASMKQEKKENVIGGIVGALLGSLVGVLSIVLLSQLGYVAALSGVVMALGVLKGYELLGGRLSKKGIVICVIVMLLMTYVGDRADWAIRLFGEGGGADAGLTIFECYRMVSVALELEMIPMAGYIFNLVLLYVFLLLGAVPTIRNKVTEKNDSVRMVKVGSADTMGI
ncbi:MAG: hypothetical protein NC079_05900 [Clostridium sp.]|nr:hypothetical protein [Acetatifactor muris]MCM1526963.1 hypothetical protein [Bacteroides sp.]MCM1563126.1 hypothetical protein [Clostridium sp.]